MYVAVNTCARRVSSDIVGLGGGGNKLIQHLCELWGIDTHSGCLSVWLEILALTKDGS